MQIKMFCGPSLITLQKAVNDFIKDKCINDIKYSINDKCHSIMVMYSEDEEDSECEEDNKGCHNCKFQYSSSDLDPCRSCGSDNSNWIKEEK